VSIFTKDCPVCAAVHPAHAVRCGCGYCFDPNKVDGVTQELEVIVQEERLYRDYLVARAQQADDAVRFAKTAQAMDPENTVKAAEALLAEQNAMTARAELDAQNARAQAVTARATVVRSNRRARRQAKAATPSPASSKTRAAPPPSIRSVLAPPPIRVPTLTNVVRTPAPPAAPSVSARTNVAAATMDAINAPPRSATKPPAPPTAVKSVSQFAVTPRNGTPAGPNTLTTAAALPKKKATIIRTAPSPSLAPSLASASAPTSSAPPRPTKAATPSASSNPTAAFRASQTAKAEQVRTSGSTSAKQECPNCYAKLAPETKRCRCGFELPQAASQIPSLSMSPEDRAAFLAALAPIGGNHND